jgi:hypothetical protein
MKLLERLVAAVAGLTHQMQGGQAQQLPPLPYQPDLGPYHLVGAPSVAAGAQAQLVDRSLMHQYGFNQAESQRAAGAAVDMDSGCAVCLLVQAYAYGPFLNKPVMTAAEVAAAAGAAAAAAVLVHANPLVYSEKERGMAEAFMLRHQSAGAVSRAAQLSAGTAWHRSMCKLAARLQTDADAWAWCGEGLMNVQRFWQLPFIYYTDSDGTPTALTQNATAAIERAIALSGRTHPLALHLYVHITESAPVGGGRGGAARADAAADALEGLAPGSGHLQHMPGHTFAREGRWADYAAANLGAGYAHNADVRAEAAGIVAYGKEHNIAAGVHGAATDGQLSLALAGARELRRIWTEACLDEGISSFYPQFSFIWRIPIGTTNESDE